MSCNMAQAEWQVKAVLPRLCAVLILPLHQFFQRFPESLALLPLQTALASPGEVQTGSQQQSWSVTQWRQRHLLGAVYGEEEDTWNTW